MYWWNFLCTKTYKLYMNGDSKDMKNYKVRLLEAYTKLDCRQIAVEHGHIAKGGSPGDEGIQAATNNNTFFTNSNGRTYRRPFGWKPPDTPGNQQQAEPISRLAQTKSKRVAPAPNRRKLPISGNNSKGRDSNSASVADVNEQSVGDADEKDSNNSSSEEGEDSDGAGSNEEGGDGDGSSDGDGDEGSKSKGDKDGEHKSSSDNEEQQYTGTGDDGKEETHKIDNRIVKPKPMVQGEDDVDDKKEPNHEQTGVDHQPMVQVERQREVGTEQVVDSREPEVDREQVADSSILAENVEDESDESVASFHTVDSSDERTRDVGSALARDRNRFIVDYVYEENNKRHNIEWTDQVISIRREFKSVHGVRATSFFAFPRHWDISKEEILHRCGIHQFSTQYLSAIRLNPLLGSLPPSLKKGLCNFGDVNPTATMNYLNRQKTTGILDSNIGATECKGRIRYMKVSMTDLPSGNCSKRKPEFLKQVSNLAQLVWSCHKHLLPGDNLSDLETAKSTRNLCNLLSIGGDKRMGFEHFSVEVFETAGTLEYDGTANEVSKGSTERYVWTSLCTLSMLDRDTRAVYYLLYKFYHGKIADE